MKIPSNYVQNEHGEWSHPSRVGRLLPTQPEQDTIPALDKGKEEHREGPPSLARSTRITVTLIRHGQRRLDDDNLTASFKALRDAIALSLEVDDANEMVVWEYRQITGKPYGTIVLIHTP